MDLSRLMQKTVDFSASARASVGFFIICLLITIWVRKNGYEGYQFGQEIGNVSAALASGEGFSNVFDHDSGPTAWTPAFYTSIYALIFVIFGTKTVASYWVLFIVRCLLLAFTFHLALKIDYSDKFNRYKFLLLPIFLIYAYFVVLKRGMDDVIFNISLSMLVIYAITKLFETDFSRVKVLFYVLAVIVPLSNISLFLGLMVLMAVMLLSNKLSVIPRTEAVALAVIMIATLVGWGYRNQQTLNQFIPFKSNLWFELHLSNVVDEDGILRFTNFREYHPLTNDQVKVQYKNLGEARFVERYKAASLEYLTQHPTDFIRKVVNRASSVFLWTQFNINNVEPASQEITPEDVNKLASQGLLLKGEWICIDAREKAFESQIRTLNLSDPQLVLTDWKAKKMGNKKAKMNLKNLMVGLLMSTLPFVALLCCLLVKPLRNHRVFLITLILFLLTIGPYVLISIHTRYQLFQMSYFVIFVFLALAFLIDRYLPRDWLIKKLQLLIDS